MSFHRFVEKHWAKRSMISYLLIPFAFLFSCILRLRRFFWRIGFVQSYRSNSYVISVGNITMGGNGKTPFTILLAKVLQQSGVKVAVSHRGYKGAFEHEVHLISNEQAIFDDAQNAGDEACLIAQNLPGIHVIVGKNRKAAIEFLECNVAPDIIILDDSFQHLKVMHDFDFVLLNANSPLGNGFIIPAGILREPISALNYADCFVVNDVIEGFDIPKKFNRFDKTIISTRYAIESLVSYQSGDTLSQEKIKVSILISGIGNPASFEASIKNLGISVLSHYTFPDHHEFDLEKDIQPITDRHKDAVIITTEKDFIKLSMFTFERPIYYAKLKVSLNEKDQFTSLLERFVKESTQ